MSMAMQYKVFSLGIVNVVQWRMNIAPSGCHFSRQCSRRL